MKATIKISFDGCREIERRLPSDTVADVISKIRTQDDIDSKIHLNLFDRSRLMNESHKISDYDFAPSIPSRQVNSFTLSTLGALGPMKVRNVIWGEGEVSDG